MMINFDMNDAMTFLNVIEHGGYANASKYLHVSPSVISKRISRLESCLKVQLLHRTTRSSAMTEAGQVFYTHCKQLQSQMNDAINEVTQHHDSPYGLLRVNAPMSFGLVHLVPAVNAFMKTYRDVHVDLILGSQYSNFIYNGLDIAIFIKDLPKTDMLQSERIALRSTGVYAAPSYIAQYGQPVEPEDLVNHNCLLYQSGPGTQVTFGQKKEWLFTRDGKPVHVPVEGTLKINSSQGLARAAIDGMGVARLSSFLVSEALSQGRLVSVLEEYCLRDIDIHAAYPTQRYVPIKVKRFIEFLNQHFHASHD